MTLPRSPDADAGWGCLNVVITVNAVLYLLGPVLLQGYMLVVLLFFQPRPKRVARDPNFAARVADAQKPLSSLTRAPDDPEELRRLLKAGKLWYGSCRGTGRFNHRYGYIIADSNPYTRTGTVCPNRVTPVGQTGGPTNPCFNALNFYKESEAGLERYLKERDSEKK